MSHTIVNSKLSRIEISDVPQCTLSSTFCTETMRSHECFRILHNISLRINTSGTRHDLSPEFIGFNPVLESLGMEHAQPNTFHPPLPMGHHPGSLYPLVGGWFDWCLLSRTIGLPCSFKVTNFKLSSSLLHEQV